MCLILKMALDYAFSQKRKKSKDKKKEKMEKSKEKMEKSQAKADRGIIHKFVEAIMKGLKKNKK